MVEGGLPVMIWKKAIRFGPLALLCKSDGQVCGWLLSPMTVGILKFKMLMQAER